MRLRSPLQAQLNLEADRITVLPAAIQLRLIRLLQRERFTCMYLENGQMIFMRRHHANKGRATVSLLLEGRSCTAAECLLG